MDHRKALTARAVAATLLAAMLLVSAHTEAAPYKYRKRDVPKKAPVEQEWHRRPTKGLCSRNIALWQSHGRYFNVKTGEWMWQRPCIFRTVEDISTQEYVIPYLVPMLENAGAYVLLPRERDRHREEMIMDNDLAEMVSERIHGTMETTGQWKKASVEGFADILAAYSGEDSPFGMGTALCANARTRGKAKNSPTAVWSVDIPAHGNYALYITYPADAKAVTDAVYTVHAAGADHRITVNQRSGAGQWVYAGTFEFAQGHHKVLTLKAESASGRGVVYADAVRLGGGMGCIEREVTSGLPRWTEGARYNLQASGVSPKVWNLTGGANDYRDDLICHGEWVQSLFKDSGIPIDMSLAFHTDSGVKKDDTIVGTLAIYTLRCNGRTRLADGTSRACCEALADSVQTQICRDLQAGCDSLWTRRDLWNRSYSESRTTGVPAMLLELLSHENFEDMKYGLDPHFRFTAARACYKGMLRFLSARYGRPYVVQPLPVRNFSAALDEDGESVRLKWAQTPDTLEATAVPTYYILYSRRDSTGWDKGVLLDSPAATLNIEKGHIYSFKVVAGNDGGLSFPSEVLSVGAPAGGYKSKVLIVNNFHRTSAPVWFDTPSFAGFDDRRDSGVPYIEEYSFSGEQYEFRRSRPFENFFNPGFGSSGQEYAGRKVAGNTFDYPFVHGSAVLKAGYAFSSTSAEAFGGDASLADGCSVVDLICGKECTVRTGSRSPLRGGVFTPELRSALRSVTLKGMNLIVSGSYIASDSFAPVYPLDDDALKEKSAEQKFVRKVLGIGLMRPMASRSGKAVSLSGDMPAASFPTAPCAETYCVESPDALQGYGLSSRILLSYSDTRLAAAVLTHPAPEYSVAALGFPLEIISSAEARDEMFARLLALLSTNR